MEAFRLYDASLGIGKFLNRFDLEGVTPHQIVYSTLGRLPGSSGAQPQSDYNPRVHLRSLLHGDEFQKRLMIRFLDAYPEKKRLLLVHIPKCAGSDLTINLMNRFPPFNFRLIDRNWVPVDAMFASLRKLVEEVSYENCLFVHGHVTLKQYLTNNLVRFGDHTFTIVRNPVDMVISKINYVLTRFSRDPDLKANDTKNWLQHVSHAKIQAALSSGDYRDIAVEMLFTPGLVETDPICGHLGEGTAASAKELCRRANIEITHVDRYEEWLALRWGVASSKRNNASQPLVSLDMLGQDGLQRAYGLTAEDRQFVESVEEQARAKDQCFILGTQLSI